jgi:predicted secreted hydrolase
VRRVLAFFVSTCLVAGAALLAAGPAWRDAERGRVLRFPADHASHPDYRIEWWYYTGHLASGEGRRFGYQVTFFRIGVDARPANPSRWTVRDLYMAHVAITDISGRRHLHAERLSRAGVGWAGAATDRYHVWVEDWAATLEDGRHRLRASVGQGFSPAGTAPIPFALDLLLEEGKPPVLHGDGGFSQKGSSPGNASHYYSLTRMPTNGTITLGGERIAVEGTSWMDHEFGTSFLEPTQAGWDWFSMQLDDGSELMVFQLRGIDGRVDPRSSGTLVARDGRSRALDAGAFALDAGRRWRSRETRGEYPVEWHIRVPGEQMDLRVRAVLDAQEMTGEVSGISYWEGAIEVTGTRAGRPVTGRGYLEMTGYSGRAMGDFLGARP